MEDVSLSLPPPTSSTAPSHAACSSSSCSHRGGCTADHSSERALLSLPTATKLDLCEQARVEASALFQEGQYERSLERFRKILVILDYTQPAPSEVARCDSLFQLVLLNSCVCKLLLGDLRGCIAQANRVLQDDARCSKALYCRAKAHRLLNELDLARADMELLLELASNSREVQIEAKFLEMDQSDFYREQLELSHRMFGQDPSIPAFTGLDRIDLVLGNDPDSRFRDFD